jgi:hypothetical protein
LVTDKGGEQQIGTAERILAEIISSDVALLVTFNQAIDGVLKNNQKAQISPHATVQTIDCAPFSARSADLLADHIGVGPAVFLSYFQSWSAVFGLLGSFSAVAA